MASAVDVANFFLTLSQPEQGDALTNLKVQKLCYYAQGFSLVLLKKPIFNDDIQAWEHGPVVPSLYHHLKASGSQPIPPPVDFDPSVLKPEEQEVLREVWDVYGQFSAWKLRNMTHDEPPWANTARWSVITHDALRAYFETQVRPSS